MAITIKQIGDGTELIIKIQGRFDFSVHQKFRRAYEQAKPARSFVIDMLGTTYLDSSALGMLLLAL